MTEMQDDAAGARRRVQRHQRHPQAGDQRRRLQFGTGYPHRGPAPACGQRQLSYQPPVPGEPSGGRRAGRLRVLTSPTDPDRGRPQQS